MGTYVEEEDAAQSTLFLPCYQDESSYEHQHMSKYSNPSCRLEKRNYRLAAGISMIILAQFGSIDVVMNVYRMGEVYRQGSRLSLPEFIPRYFLSITFFIIIHITDRFVNIVENC